MHFRTELFVAPQATPLPPGARVLTVGSCFAAVLGQHLKAARLPVLENPFGTVLNPVAACRLLAVACGADEYDLADRAVARDGRWFSYDAPSSLSGATPEELHANLEAKLTETREFVRTADALVLTLGTAWAWRLDDEVVANCHKQPGALFQKTLLSVQEIVMSFAEMHAWLLRVNPKLRVVLTVSPVRHPKETLEGSSVSKSTLRLACHHLAGLVRGVAYFPAYELLLDDLRDYRFFAADMLHPSPLAEAYIFDKFVGAWFDGRFAAAREAWAEIDRARAHRSANPTGEAHQQFLLATLDKLDVLARQGFDISTEAAGLTAQLTQPRPPRPVPVAAFPPAAPVAAPIAAPPASTAPPASRPIKPIIRITPLTERPATPKPAEPTDAPRLPLPVATNEPAAESTAASTDSPIEGREERRGGRRGNRRGRGGRDRDNRRDRPEAGEMRSDTMPLEEQPTAEVPAPPTAATAENGAQAGPGVTSPEGATAKKRRGRRGGRRHKQRREGELTEVENSALAFGDEFGDEFDDELQAGAEAAAELAVEDQLPEVGPESLAVTLLPAEEVALEAGLATEPQPEPAPEPIAAPARKPARPARTKATSASGRKITLQKVKPTVAEEPVAAAPAPAEKPPRAPRPARGKKVALADEVSPAPPVEAPTVELPPVAESVTPAPVAAAVPVPPTTPESRTARTPGKARAKGPVATPVEKAAAARTVKKAGVGALLAALGGAGGAAPARRPSRPASPPAEPALPEPPPASVAVAVVAPAGPEPALVASPAAKPKRPAKPRTPKAK